MRELVEMIVRALVDEPERVVVREVQGERSIIYEVRVAPDDVGKAIGRHGRLANALRTLVRAAATKNQLSAWVDIAKLAEPDGAESEESSEQSDG